MTERKTTMHPKLEIKLFYHENTEINEDKSNFDGFQIWEDGELKESFGDAQKYIPVVSKFLDCLKTYKERY